MTKTCTPIRIFLPFMMLLLLQCSPEAPKAPGLPNILLLVADDLGYADLGCYGGDIHTPNIDALARSGIRFSRFHTAPMCAPTRAMLLTGNDNHIAGMGRQDLKTSEFGYEGMLTNRVVTIPSLLRAQGYHTYMAGKWHLGDQLEANPVNKGFEHSYVILEGAANHYDDQGLFEEDPTSPYTEDGEITQWPEGAYSTDLYTDKLIEYIDRHQHDGKPFFAFAAYTSPHWPLQVDSVFWKKYEGQFDQGYDQLKHERLESLKAAKLISASSEAPPNHSRVTRSWSELTEEEQLQESRKMELYAGMVDNLDYNIGRLLDHLRQIGRFENTLIIFMGDNGAASEDFYDDDEYGPFIRQYFSNDNFGEWGDPNTFVSYGPQWAEAGSSPFRYFKGFTSEGGIIAPMLISGKGITLKNAIYQDLVTVQDIAPTIYEAAGVSYPLTFKEDTIYPLLGSSILQFATGAQARIHGDDYIFGTEHGGYAMLIKGPWKITNNVTPFSKDNFGLYNLRNDVGEFRDLKEDHPDIYADLLNEWEAFAERIKPQFPTPKAE